MGHIRRLSPLSWRLRTINLFFSGIIISLLAFFFLFASPSFASEPPIALLSIPSARLASAEIISAPPRNHKFPTPDTQVGLYRPHADLTFLYGHSTTVFTDLPSLRLGDPISFYDLETKTSTTYHVTDITTLPSAEVHMSSLLTRPDMPTLLLMTCSGNYVESTDTYDARLIITAQKD